MNTHLKAATKFTPKSPQTHITTTLQRHSISQSYTRKTEDKVSSIIDTKKTIVQPKESLGSVSWDSMFCSKKPCSRIGYSVVIMTENEWKSTLKNLDDKNELRAVRGFLFLATNPSYARQTKHPLGFENFRNNIKRAPNKNEIMNFMRALYSLGDELDLPNTVFEASGAEAAIFRDRVSKLISLYQASVLNEMAERGDTVEEKNIKAIVEQGDDRDITMNMIYNAVATAYKGLDLIASSKLGADGKSQRTKAHTLMRNAGWTARFTLEKHDSLIKAREHSMLATFNIVWGAVPGGGALTTVAKGILAHGAKEVIKAMNSGNNLKAQTEGLRAKFEEAAHTMIGQGTWSQPMENSLQTGVNAFVSSLQ